MNNTMRTRQPHRQVKLNYMNEIVEIDEELASLIQAIWRAGIGTMMCCQEVEEGIAWIEFDSIQDLLKFLNLTVDYDDHRDSLYNRVHVQNYGSELLPEWEYRINLMDIEENDPQRSSGGNVLFEATVGVYFPKEDISILLEKLEKFNANLPPRQFSVADLQFLLSESRSA